MLHAEFWVACRRLEERRDARTVQLMIIVRSIVVCRQGTTSSVCRTSSTIHVLLLLLLELMLVLERVQKGRLVVCRRGLVIIAEGLLSTGLLLLKVAEHVICRANFGEGILVQKALLPHKHV